MGKKKKKEKEEVVIWCYYCDRTFADEAMLIQHQKAKHFKCPDCNRKLNTAQGLVIHAYQVHKRSVTTVPGAVPGRDSVETEIFGMAGIPDGMKQGGQIDPNEQPPDPKKAKLEAAANTVIAAPPPYPQAYSAAVGYNPQAMHMPPVPGAPYPMMGQPPYAPPGYGGYGYPGMGGPPAMRPPPMGMAPAPPYMAHPGYAPMPRPPAPLPPPGVPGMAPPGPGPAGPPAPLFPIRSTGPPPPQALGSGVGPSLPPAGGALFPIAGAGQPPGLPPPAAAAPFQGAATPDAGPVDAGLVWQDEVMSPEEKRAQMPKYAAARAQMAAPPVRPYGY